MQKKAVVEAAGNGLFILQEAPVQVKRQRSMRSSAFLREKVQRFGWLHLPDVLQRE